MCTDYAILCKAVCLASVAIGQFFSHEGEPSASRCSSFLLNACCIDQQKHYEITLGLLLVHC